jgi:Fis family transcriptional regulator
MTGQVTKLEIPNREPVQQVKPLSDTVAEALQIYFKQLDGHTPDELYRLVMDQVEKPLMLAVMEYCRGNQTKAARCLGLNRGTLRKKLKHHNIS